MFSSEQKYAEYQSLLSGLAALAKSATDIQPVVAIARRYQPLSKLTENVFLK